MRLSKTQRQSLQFLTGEVEWPWGDLAPLYRPRGDDVQLGCVVRSLGWSVFLSSMFGLAERLEWLDSPVPQQRGAWTRWSRLHSIEYASARDLVLDGWVVD